MKLIKTITSKDNAINSIVNSMNSKIEVTETNLLDACGCTGNSMC